MAYELFSDVVNAARGGDHPLLQHDNPLLEKLNEVQRGVVDAGLTSQLIMFTKDISTGTATTAIFSSNAPFAFEVIDVILQARATEGGGTIVITNGSSNITNAIVCATNNARTVAGTIDNVYSKIAAGGSLSITMGGGTPANMKALVTILAIPTV